MYFDLYTNKDHHCNSANHKYQQTNPFPHSLPGLYRLIFIEAPERQIERLNGKVGPAWYDCKALPCNHPDRANMDHFYTSVEELSDIIEKEITPKVYIAGFSQGSVMSLAVALLGQIEPKLKVVPPRIAGCFASGGIVVPEVLEYVM